MSRFFEHPQKHLKSELVVPPGGRHVQIGVAAVVLGVEHLYRLAALEAVGFLTRQGRLHQTCVKN